MLYLSLHQVTPILCKVSYLCIMGNVLKLKPVIRGNIVKGIMAMDKACWSPWIETLAKILWVNPHPEFVSLTCEDKLLPPPWWEWSNVINLIPSNYLIIVVYSIVWRAYQLLLAGCPFIHAWVKWTLLMGSMYSSSTVVSISVAKTILYMVHWASIGVTREKAS